MLDPTDIKDIERRIDRSTTTKPFIKPTIIKIVRKLSPIVNCLVLKDRKRGPTIVTDGGHAITINCSYASQVWNKEIGEQYLAEVLPLFNKYNDGKEPVIKFVGDKIRVPMNNGLIRDDEVVMITKVIGGKVRAGGIEFNRLTKTGIKITGVS